MDEPLELTYFNWLCAKVLDSHTRDYEPLMEILFRTEFVYKVPEDQHRWADGLELRHDFLKRRQKKRNSLDAIPVSILEVFIAFANRASFQTDGPARDWFWRFLSNLGLDQFNRVSEADVPLIEDVLYAFVWRIYEPNGY